MTATNAFSPVRQATLRTQRRAVLSKVGEDGGHARFVCAMAFETRADKQNLSLFFQTEWAHSFASSGIAPGLSQKAYPCIQWQAILAACIESGSELPISCAASDHIPQFAAAITEGGGIDVARPTVSRFRSNSVCRRRGKQAMKLRSPFALGKIQSSKPFLERKS